MPKESKGFNRPNLPVPHAKSAYERFLTLKVYLDFFSGYLERVELAKGHKFKILEMRLKNFLDRTRHGGLKFGALCESIAYVEKFGDLETGAVPSSIMAYLFIHLDDVAAAARRFNRRENNKARKMRRKNAQLTRLRNELKIATEKFGSEMTLGEALERLDGANVIDLNERKKAA